MDDQQKDSAEVVTINEAIKKLNDWLSEGDYEKVKQGAEEILEVEPDNKEAKELLSKAESKSGAETAEKTPPPAEEEKKPAEEPSEPEEPVKEEGTFNVESEAEPEKPAEAPVQPEPEKPAEKPEIKVETQQPSTKPDSEPEKPEPKPEAEKEAGPTPYEIFGAKKEKKEEQKPEKPEEVIESTKVEEKKPAEKQKGSKALWILVILFLLVIGGLVGAFFMGFLDPFFDWIFDILGF